MTGYSNAKAAGEVKSSAALIRIRTLSGSSISVSRNGSVVKRFRQNEGHVDQADSHVTTFFYRVNANAFGDYTVTAITGSDRSTEHSKAITISSAREYEIKVLPLLVLLQTGDTYTDRWTKLSSYEISSNENGFTLSRNGSNTYVGFYTTDGYDFTMYDAMKMTYSNTSANNNHLGYGTTQGGYVGNVNTTLPSGTIALDISSITGTCYPEVSNAPSGSVTFSKIWLEG